MALNFDKLLGKHVLVIGGSSGIGRAVAEGALAAGATVTIASSSQERLDKATEDLKAALETSGRKDTKVGGIAVDLTSADVEAALAGLLTAAARLHGTINHIVHTAADAIPILPLTAITPDSLGKALHMRALVPILLAKAIAGGGHLPLSRASSLTLTGGNASRRPARDWALAAFCTTGMEGAVRELALELAPVRVNIVAPGFVDTDLWGAGREGIAAAVGAKVPTGSAGQVEDVAEAYLWFLKDGNATGVVARTESGSTLV